MINYEILRKSAPAALNTVPSNRMSDRYEAFPTMDVLNVLDRNGWEIASASQRKSKQPETAVHTIRLTNSNVGKIGEDPIEIVLINSLDGTRKLTFSMGVFRLVCSNGLIIKTEDLGQITVKHIHKTFEADVLSAIQEIEVKAPKVIREIDRYKGIELSDTAFRKFAQEAIALRYTEFLDLNGNPDRARINANFDLEALMTPQRIEDTRPDLWTGFNILQENLVRGNFTFNAEIKGVEKMRKARPITDLSKDFDVNGQLWELLQQYA